MRQYVFSPDDQMFPVYCIQCKVQVPKSVSNVNQGFCDDCIQARHQQAAAAAASQQAQMHGAQHMHFALNTGLGICPQCHSPNIQQIAQKSKTRANLQSAGLVLIVGGILTACLCFVGIVMIPVGVILLIMGLVWSDTTQDIHRHCNYCGFGWRV